MLEEVLRLEPGANGARLALAECYEGDGRLASAYQSYSKVAEAAARLGQTERQKAAEARAQALSPRVGSVIVQIGPQVQGLAGLAITACGAPLALAEQGKPRHADRGPCKVTAIAPGKAPWERTVEVADGATASITVDRLDDAAAQPPVTSLPLGTAPPAGTPPPLGNKPPPDRPPLKPPLAPPPAPSPLSHRGRFGATVRIDVDVLSQGAVTVVGATFGASDHIEIGLSGLLGKRGGFEAAATGYLLTGAVKPFVNVGVPVLFEDDAYAGIRGAAGVQWDFHRHAGVFAAVGAAYFPEVPRGYTHAVLLPALGVQGRL